MRNKIISIALLAALLGGCGQDVKPLDYYKVHLDEAKKVSDGCDWQHHFTMEKDLRKNCENAADAVRWKRMEDDAKVPYGAHAINPTVYP